MMKQLMAPRTVFLDFPLGRQCDRPNDREQQMGILKDAPAFLEKADTPGQVLELPYTWDKPFSWESYNKDVAEMIQEEDIPPQDWKPKG